MHKTLESVLARGESLEDLVKRSQDLSVSTKFFYKDAKYAFYISPVSVAPVGFVPWKSYQSGKSIFQIADRSIKPVENSRYQAETQRFSLNIRSRFAVGAYETDETGSIVKI